MAEFVEKDTIKEYLKRVIFGADQKLDRWVDDMPVADLRPVVRGRWVWDENGVDWGIGAWRCSACWVRSPMWWNTERTSPMNKNGHCFCPNCGAEMDGDGE